MGAAPALPVRKQHRVNNQHNQPDPNPQRREAEPPPQLRRQRNRRRHQVIVPAPRSPPFPRYSRGRSFLNSSSGMPSVKITVSMGNFSGRKCVLKKCTMKMKPYRQQRFVAVDGGGHVDRPAGQDAREDHPGTTAAGPFRRSPPRPRTPRSNRTSPNTSSARTPAAARLPKNHLIDPTNSRQSRRLNSMLSGPVTYCHHVLPLALRLPPQIPQVQPEIRERHQRAEAVNPARRFESAQQPRHHAWPRLRRRISKSCRWWPSPRKLVITIRCRLRSKRAETPHVGVSFQRVRVL